MLYGYRVSQCLSRPWNWDPPTTSPVSECEKQKRGNTLASRWGGGVSQFRRLERKLVYSVYFVWLCLLNTNLGGGRSFPWKFELPVQQLKTSPFFMHCFRKYTAWMWWKSCCCLSYLNLWRRVVGAAKLSLISRPKNNNNNNNLHYSSN